MAISRVGYATVNGDTVSGSTSISVPSDADFAVGFVGSWNDSETPFSNPVLSLNSVNLTQHQAVTSSGGPAYNGIALETLANPATGAQTLAWNWGFTPYPGWHQIVVVFYQGVDQANPVTDSKSTANGDDVTGMTGDAWMVGGVYCDTNPTLTQDGQTQITAYQSSGDGWMGVAEESGAEGDFYSSNADYASAAALTLKAASASIPVNSEAVIPMEALASRSVPGSLPFEALLTQDVSPTLHTEVLAQTFESATPSLEALTSINASIQVDLEALSDIQAARVIHLEALGQAVAEVSALAQIPLEGLSAVTATLLLPFEAKQSVSATAQLPLEVLASIDSDITLSLEALTRLAAEAQINLEALGQALITADAIIHIESMGYIGSSIVLNAEALSGIDVFHDGGFESLGTLLSDVTAPIEALLQIRATVSPNIEFISDVVLTTPSARIYTVDNEVRVIAIEAESRTVYILNSE